MLRIETVYQTKNRCYLAAKPAEHIGILVHSTGANNRNLKRYVDAPELVGVRGIIKIVGSEVVKQQRENI